MDGDDTDVRLVLVLGEDTDVNVVAVLGDDNGVLQDDETPLRLLEELELDSSSPATTAQSPLLGGRIRPESITLLGSASC